MISPQGEQIAKTLSDENNAVSPAIFPRNPREAAMPGMYSWRGYAVACSVLGKAASCDLAPLFYVGQAGATKWPSGTRSHATLASRIGSQHIRGNARSSTFRLTISALLLDALTLQPGGGGKLDPVSNKIVSEWIEEHLRVALAPFDDRDQLSAIEAEVVRRLDPPLNLDHCPANAVRTRLTALRRALR
jgi:hypothetical protein